VRHGTPLLKLAALVALVALAALSTASGCAALEAPGDHAIDVGPRQPPGVSRAPAAAVAAVATLPAIPLRRLDDQAVRLEEAATGKVALVSFWATWCDACTAEVDALNRLEEHVRGSGGMVIGVAVGESREKAAEFARQHGLAYAQLVDEKLALADALGQKRLPATMVLDRQGRVVFIGGSLDEKALAAFRGAMGRP
jgi:peroxiredoxin